MEGWAFTQIASLNCRKNWLFCGTEGESLLIFTTSSSTTFLKSVNCNYKPNPENKRGKKNQGIQTKHPRNIKRKESYTEGEQRFTNTPHLWAGSCFQQIQVPTRNACNHPMWRATRERPLPIPSPAKRESKDQNKMYWTEENSNI